MADMIRGRIRALKGVPVDQVAIAEDSQWAVRGDRGFTTSATLPENSTLKAGEWWPEDYSGPPLFSLTADLAQGMGLVPGDEVTVNILGRDITGTIASTREVDWASLSMNFAFVVSPGAFAGAPRTYIATVRADADRVPAIEAAVAEAAANVSIIRVDDALAVVVGLMEDVGAAVRAAAGITLVAGILVLAGSFAANHGRRLREAVTLKVLGATRGMVLRAYLTEYGILGFATGLIAALVGSVAAWAVLVFVMRAEWVFLPGVVAGTLAVCVGFTVLAGFAGTWGALGARPAPYLRNE
jgi:putative ABC transport system permease protein